MQQLAAILVCGLLLGACSSAPKKPTTHTPAPSLDSSIEMTGRLQRYVSDAKDGVRRARSLRDRIDNKASLLE